MARNIYRNVAYGLSDSLLNVFQQPIVSERNPGINDKYQLGTIWVNKSTDDAFILTSVVANVATWVGVAGGTGTFTSLTVNPGDVTVTSGDVEITLGSLTVGASANIGSNLTVSGGDLTVSTGDVTVTLGDVAISAGSLSVNSGSIAAGGVVSGSMLSAINDGGSGFATITTFTNATNTTQGVGTLAVKSTNGNNGTNAGFIKVYVGLTPAYIPYYTNIAP